MLEFMVWFCKRIGPDAKADLPMRRCFNRKQRLYLAILAGFRCEACGAKLNSSLHGDHVQPHSRGGATLLRNGQALCDRCNLKKGVQGHDYRNSSAP
jgi:5-methylcytosine-specific restriction endonuclease McrA